MRGFAGQDLTYRFAWTFPVVLSPKDPHTLYVGANVVFRSRDEGRTWEVTSGDLTRNDSTRLGPSGGPITQDNGGAEMYGTLSTLAPSPQDPRVCWAGSDDGLIHVTQDEGQTWRNVTPSLLPPWALISAIEASPHDAGTAWVAATRYKLDDPAPYVLKTVDFGENWDLIVDGIPPDQAPRVIREDPKARGLLFLGTELGLYVSLDGGQHWQSFQQNLPVVPVYDLAVHDDDVIVATHGRSFWILDDLTPLRDMMECPKSAHLVRPRTTYRYHRGDEVRGRSDRGYASMDTATVSWARRFDVHGTEISFTNAGDNPMAGVIVSYFLSESATGPVQLEFADSSGAVIQAYTSDEAANGTRPPTSRLTTEAGLHRFVWDPRYPDAVELPGAVFRGGSGRGPLAPPGLYRVSLSVDGQVLTVPWVLAPDPRLAIDATEVEEQFQFLLKVRDRLSAVHRAVILIRRIRAHLAEYEGRLGAVAAGPRLRRDIGAVRNRLDTIEDVLAQPRAHIPLDYLKYPPGLNVKLATLKNAVEQADAGPTMGAYNVFASLAARADEQFAQLRAAIGEDVLPLLARLTSETPTEREIGEKWLCATPMPGSHRRSGERPRKGPTS